MPCALATLACHAGEASVVAGAPWQHLVSREERSAPWQYQNKRVAGEELKFSHHARA